MSAATGDDYMLSRLQGEAERLNMQHRLYVDNFEYYLHPCITSRLPPDGKVADIATGTAVWLRDLAPTLPSTVSLVGFDVSPDQFPAPDTLAKNIDLRLHNAKLPFPPELHGQFDAVHVRLLVAALPTHDDWVTVVRNCLQLLKPGGHLQWCESNFADLKHSPGGVRSADTPAPTELPAIGTRFGPLMLAITTGLHELFMRGWSTLPGILRDAGCEVGVDMVSSDRVPGKRGVGALIASSPLTDMFEAGCKMGAIANDGPEDIKRRAAMIGPAMRADAKEGMYLRWDIHNIIARKPLGPA